LICVIHNFLHIEWFILALTLTCTFYYV